MSSIPETAAGILGGTTLVGAAGAALLARSRSALRGRLRERTAELSRSELDVGSAQAKYAQLLAELRHLVTNRLPAQVQNVESSRFPVPGPLHPDLAEAAELGQSVLDLLAGSVEKSRRRVDASAQAALRGASTDIQALLFQLQTRITELQMKAESVEPDIARVFFEMDHLNEQVARRVQRAAIVCGGWPGMVRPDTFLSEVVSGAQSRLAGYERIKVTSQLPDPRTGVAGRVAEPLAVALGELMANALEHSRDDLEVQVALMQGDSGTVSVVVDDAGTGMTPEAIRRGRRLVSGEDREDLLLTELGDPPALGFAACGRLAADHGFRIEIGQVSPYGGTRAVVSIPPDLLTEMDEEEQMSALAAGTAAPPRSPHVTAPAGPEDFAGPGAREDGGESAGSPAAASSAPAEPASSSEPAPPADANDLPQRRRRNRAAQEAAAPARPVDPDRAAAVWDQFQQGVRSGRSDGEDGDNSENSGEDEK
ncbi:ATP-binding protein [Phaeacidiphilus oryzae]|uniref:ATP-binding protein n=1 Tax=Phaeacidiphilus oryzae TaxID=348818 RepID=UPI0013783E62|nr:sensor histidine kinase [Phaeacidiphilus oryzae]